MHYVILCKTTWFVKSLSENHLYPVKIFAFFSNSYLNTMAIFVTVSLEKLATRIFLLKGTGLSILRAVFLISKYL